MMNGTHFRLDTRRLDGCDQTFIQPGWQWDIRHGTSDLSVKLLLGFDGKVTGITLSQVPHCGLRFSAPHGIPAVRCQIVFCLRLMAIHGNSPVKKVASRRFRSVMQ